MSFINREVTSQLIIFKVTCCFYFCITFFPPFVPLHEAELTILVLPSQSSSEWPGEHSHLLVIGFALPTHQSLAVRRKGGVPRVYCRPNPAHASLPKGQRHSGHSLLCGDTDEDLHGGYHPLHLLVDTSGSRPVKGTRSAQFSSCTVYKCRWVDS